MELYKVLVRPVITEKSTKLTAMNKYTFEVDRDSNKALIKQAVKQRFNVEVEAINVITVHPKERGAGKRRGFAPAWKKAVVTLKEGHSIPELSGAVTS